MWRKQRRAERGMKKKKSKETSRIQTYITGKLKGQSKLIVIYIKNLNQFFTWHYFSLGLSLCFHPNKLAT